jgi:NAD(P)-dependent dehydrogenase (short-subunit alcohol dehydrogenase family)
LKNIDLEELLCARIKVVNKWIVKTVRSRFTRGTLLSGKVAVITGAASPRGIGKATAQAFAHSGARVAILDLYAANPSVAAVDIGAEHMGLACDVTSKSDCEQAVERVLNKYGQIDVLVNNAGISQPQQIMEIAPADYEAVTDVSLRGTLYMSQAVVPHMRSRRTGSIICVSSVAAQRGGGLFGGSHYAAAKAGVLGLSRAMARELGSDGVRVNSVTPGLIQTDIWSLNSERIEEVLKGIPLNRLGQPYEVANSILFLASELSSYLTGVTLDVNGGMLIH